MIIILGMPGAGKTTQTKLLAEKLGCPWLSMGELIRQQATGQARAQMLKGKIIDDEITLDILYKALKPLGVGKKQCVLEGNPRSIPQAQWWMKKIDEGEIKLDGLIHLVIDGAETKRRLSKRGRMDDTAAVMEKRIAEYNRTVVPTLEYLESQGFEIHRVKAEGTIEEVASRIQKALKLS